MSKYIDADELLKRLNACKYPAEKTTMRQVTYNAAISDACRSVDAMPAADVVEVRHGEWVFKFYCGNMSGYDYGMNCSVCGKPTHRQFAEKMPPYCPNCGSRMDLESADE